MLANEWFTMSQIETLNTFKNTQYDLSHTIA